jgi:hypothetical protein
VALAGSHPQTMEGTVKTVNWTNPHITFVIEKHVKSGEPADTSGPLSQPHHPRARSSTGAATSGSNHTKRRAPTEASERLLRVLGPRFDEIEAGLAELSELRDKPAGTIRITSGASTQRKRSSGLHWRSSCRTIPTSRSSSTSTRA